jgi:hypothetical protein
LLPVFAVLVGIAVFAAMFESEFFKTHVGAVLAHWVALVGEYQ